MATQNYHTLKNSSVLVPATSADLGTSQQPYGNLYLAGNLTLGGGAGTITATSTVVPKISGLTYPNGATAANPTGGETITINGSGFLSGLNVYVNNLQVASASQVSLTQATFVSPVNSAGNYPLAVVNSDGGSATFVAGITYSNVPVWTTSAGSLGTFQEGNSIANTIAATDGALSITYSVTSGSLPGGLSLGSANGNITGTLSNVTAGTNVTYNFTVGAADPANQVVTRNFSYVVSGDTVTWSSPTNGTNKSIVTGGAISNIGLSATSTFGRTVTYGATCLPTGLSISGGNIVGTPTVIGTKTATIYANTNTKSSSITVNFTVTSPFISATGGTITTVGNYKIHTFTTGSTFTPSVGGTVQYLIVGGGGGGGGSGYTFGAGGGAGGFVTGCTTVTAQAYTICVGGGGAAGSAGCNSVAFGITAYGGGVGGTLGSPGGGGGSGGGGGGGTSSCFPGPAGGSATHGSQGHSGGRGNRFPSCGRSPGGGGGGAGAIGACGSFSGATGGDGLPNPISGSTIGQCVSGTLYVAGGGGGGGGGNFCGGGIGGAGGGGRGGTYINCRGSYSGYNATVNTGGGGGGGGPRGAYQGGSGVVIIKYQFQ